ncbi:MAG: hypothetical protein LJE69_19965 [Thiohalocapsa sp.]|jgi:hypothetical protein|uniref:hypothetical protein n=1 Tax=Thiohalocapsa sp. TaxID=2497641 RepID=UPI0025E46F2A|nr:hypothetical protein [Thiohalocapsa sp.]MCG6943514.1 hypothetical protein [Thiohalocapsa sp.]
MNASHRARHLKPIPGWGGFSWWRKARICCGQPTFAYSLLFALVGIAFMLAAPLLDPNLAVVGLILLAVAVFMFATFWLLAYRAFGHDDEGHGSAQRH